MNADKRRLQTNMLAAKLSAFIGAYRRLPFFAVLCALCVSAVLLAACAGEEKWKEKGEDPGPIIPGERDFPKALFLPVGRLAVLPPGLPAYGPKERACRKAETPSSK